MNINHIEERIFCEINANDIQHLLSKAAMTLFFFKPPFISSVDMMQMLCGFDLIISLLEWEHLALLLTGIQGLV